MFTDIKQQTKLLDVLSHYANRQFIEAGDATYEFEDKQCPLPGCGHYDCFKVKEEECDEFGEDKSYYKCFSCDRAGDAINFVQDLFDEDSTEAAQRIIEDFNVQVETNFSPVQGLFNTAADYYHQNLIETSRKIKTLDLHTPRSFQEKVRGHDLENISRAKIGFSDGGLKDFLESLGYDEAIILESGLAREYKSGGSSKVRDFFRGGFFIYPHFVKGKVSTFTIKDPEKEVEYQLPKKFRLNGVTFYSFNADSHHDQVALVEGENDALSLLDKGWTGTILASIGSLTKDQIKALGETYSGRDVITFFDRDDAGDKYRKKAEGVVHKLNSLHHAVVPDDVKDIDEYLQKGGNLVELIKSATPVENQGLAQVAVEDNLDVQEDKGCYFKVTFDKDGNAKNKVLSDFTIRLTSVYLRGSERNREVVIVRSDGVESMPEYIDSTTKVNLRNFKVFAANAVDATFYGSENDLADMWKRVYRDKPPKLVHVPFMVGYLDTPRSQGWLFKNAFIDPSGNLLSPNDDGVFWMDPQQKTGIRPTSLSLNGSNELNDVPQLNFVGEPRHRQELIGEFVSNLGKNLGSLGDALTIAAWVKGCAYSDSIYKKYRFFPFLFLWGRHGKGKTNITKWILSLFSMQEHGYTTIPQLGSGVGFSRKAGYYSCMPMAVDEIRNDYETKEKYSIFRAWFNKSTRTKGVREDFGVKEEALRANFMFAGEDVFDDPALSSRCLPVKISTQNRELRESYQWMETRTEDLSGIGLEWLLESMRTNSAELLREITDVSRLLMDEHKCASRTAQMWAITYVMGRTIADQHFPEFKFWDHIVASARKVELNQESDSIISQFFDVVEGLQTGIRPEITSDHIVREGNYLHIWLTEVYRIASQKNRSLQSFSKKYIEESLMEEPYYVSKDRAYMGDQKRRRVITLDLTEAPEVIGNIAQHYAGNRGVGNKESQDELIDSQV